MWPIDDDHEPDDDTEEESNEPDRFHDVTSYLAREFRGTLLRYVGQSALPATSRIAAAKLAVALDRMPVPTPGVWIRASAVSRNAGGGATVSIEVSDWLVRLSVIETYYGIDGSDHDSRTLLVAGTDGRIGDADADEAEENVREWILIWSVNAESLHFEDESEAADWDLDDDDDLDRTEDGDAPATGE